MSSEDFIEKKTHLKLVHLNNVGIKNCSDSVNLILVPGFGRDLKYLKPLYFQSFTHSKLASFSDEYFPAIIFFTQF